MYIEFYNLKKTSILTRTFDLISQNIDFSNSEFNLIAHIVDLVTFF